MDEQQQVTAPTPMPMSAEPDIASILGTSAAPEATPAPAVAEAPAQAPAPAPAPQAPPAEPNVPLHVLLEERKERQAYQRQLQQFIEMQQRASQPQPQPIDPVAEPERFAAAVQHALVQKDQQMQEMAVHQRANTSEMIAKGKHGAQAVEAAREAALQAGLGQYFLSKSDPYAELLDWHRGQLAAKEIGDPAAYKEKLKAEILAELTKGTPTQQPGAARVLPPSLSTATRASAASPTVQDTGDFFKTMFSRPNRT